MWLGKSNLSKALTLAKTQLESLSVSSLIHETRTLSTTPRKRGGNALSTLVRECVFCKMETILQQIVSEFELHFGWNRGWP
ncbi:hypothetical protein YC2023_114302 [Brassica napus]